MHLYMKCNNKESYLYIAITQQKLDIIYIYIYIYIYIDHLLYNDNK